MGSEFEKLAHAYRAGQIDRRTFIRKAIALGTVAPALRLFPALGAAPPDIASQRPLCDPSDDLCMNPDDPPPGTLLAIAAVTPLAGSMTGGYRVLIQGSGFQPGAAIAFGSSQLSDVTFLSNTQLQGTVPMALAAGSVPVTVVNLDGSSASQPGGFTYIDPSISTDNAAQVIGVAPASVLENTSSTLLIRGYNLIRAYTQGFFALRGPTRASISIIDVTTSHDDQTNTDALHVMVRVVCTPPLEAHERMSIQILASTRPGASDDMVVETSRSMFTVLPQSLPVILGVTTQVQVGQPSLVVVAGRNLNACSLALSDGSSLPVHYRDDRTLAGVILLDETLTSPLAQVVVHDQSGAEYSRFQIEAIQDAVIIQQDAKQAISSESADDKLEGRLAMQLEPAPNQRFIAPTASDGVAVSLQTHQAFMIPFNWANFEITILSIDIVFELVNEVRLLPHFDGGGVFGSPVVAKVGQIFGLRAMGLLLALRVDVRITIEVVLIIGFRFDIWPYGLFNEFPGYGWAIGSIVLGIRIEISVIFTIAWLAAIVLPDGRLRVLSSGILQLGVNVFISSDEHRLTFDSDVSFEAHFNSVRALPTSLTCAGMFELISDQGETTFQDDAGGNTAYYFVRQSGRCCIPWEFDLQLSRFDHEGHETSEQGRFQTEFCLEAQPSEQYLQIYVSSEPPPTGQPPALELPISGVAQLTTLVRQVDQNGTPISEPVDIRSLGYEVEYFLPGPPEVLDALQLTNGTAYAILDGENEIRPRISMPPDNQAALYSFWPQHVVGFSLAQSVESQGSLRFELLGLRVRVQANQALRAEAVIAYRDANGNVVPVVVEGERAQIVRFEPDERQRDYLLALRLLNPEIVTTQRQLSLTVSSSRIVLERNGQALRTREPLAGISRSGGRSNRREPSDFFAGGLSQANRSGTVTLPANPVRDTLYLVEGLTITPNHVEQGTDTTPTSFVPPGIGPRNRVTTVHVQLQTDRQQLVLRSSTIRMAVTNPENFEEYLRVMVHAQASIQNALGDWLSSFRDQLRQQGMNTTFLHQQGAALWKKMYEWVQAGNLDDRPLYYARLRAIGLLRSYAREQNLSLGQLTIDEFEFPSRGLAPGGTLQFDSASAQRRKAIVTGFDPYQLLTIEQAQVPEQEAVDRSNASGLVALSLNNKPLNDTDPSSPLIRSAIFPVRYREFDVGLIEHALDPIIGVVIGIVSTSQNSTGTGVDLDYYDLERFAGRYRSQYNDNNNRPVSSQHPISDAKYYETTLPATQVITSELQSRHLPGPNSEQTPFVYDQSFRVFNTPGQRSRDERSGSLIPHRFQYEPFQSEDASWQPITAVPDRVTEEGSGGQFLSNEMFYRIARLRSWRRPSLATGHLHIPGVSNEPSTKGPGLIRGVTEALQKIFQHSFLIGSQQVDLGRIRTGATSQSTTRFTNNLGVTISVASIDVPPPFTVVPAQSLPATLAPGAVLELTCACTPPAIADYEDRAVLRDSNGQVIAQIVLRASGTGPAPIIIDFAPRIAYQGDPITIIGENLDTVTTATIGLLETSILMQTPTTLEIEAIANGYIRVVAPYGEASSARAFRLIRPLRDENP